MTSADVVYSFERLMALKRGSYRNIAAVTGVEAPEHTVVLSLDAPFPALVQALTRIYIVNSALVQGNEQEGDFGGPQRPRRRQRSMSSPPSSRSSSLRLRRSRVLEGLGRQPCRSRHLPRDQGGVRAPPGAGECRGRLGDDRLGRDLQCPGRESRLQTFSDPTLNQLYFAFNQENEYLRDPKVREALSLVYDYNGHVEQARGGKPRSRGPLPSAIPFFDEAMQPSTMDVEAAKAALAESADPDGGFSLEMIYQGTAPEDDRRSDQAGAAELNIEIVPVAMGGRPRLILSRHPKLPCRWRRSGFFPAIRIQSSTSTHCLIRPTSAMAA